MTDIVARVNEARKAGRWVDIDLIDATDEIKQARLVIQEIVDAYEMNVVGHAEIKMAKDFLKKSQK